MSTPYLSSATGEPLDARRMIAVQSAQDVPPAEADYDEFWSNGGPFVLESQSITPQIIANSPEPLPDMPGPLTIGNGPMALGDVDPDNIALQRIVTNIMRKYTQTNPGTGHYRKECFVDGATAGAAYLALLSDDNNKPRTRFLNGLCSQLTVAASPGANLLVNANILFGKFDMLGLVTQTAGTGSTKPSFSGYVSSMAWAADATDADVYLKIVDASSQTYQAKVGAAAVYGAATYVFSYDQDNRVWDEDGVPIGTFAEQLKFRLPTGATITDGDEFKLAKRRADFGASGLSTRRSIYSASTTFIVYDPDIAALKEIGIEGGWTLTITAPDIQRQVDTGGRQSAQLFRRGPVVCEVQIQRELINLDHQKAALNATPIGLAIQCETDDRIAATITPYRFMFAAGAAVPRGGLFDTPVGGRGHSEQFTFRCGVPASAFSFTPLGEATPISVANAGMVILDNAQSGL